MATEGAGAAHQPSDHAKPKSTRPVSAAAPAPAPQPFPQPLFEPILEMADPSMTLARRRAHVRVLGSTLGNGAAARAIARSRAPTSEALNRSAGAVQRLGGPALTERQKVDKALEAKTDSGLVKDIDDFSVAKPDERITLAEILVTNYTAFFGPRDQSCLTRIFTSFGNDLKYVADKKPFFFEKCLKEWPGLMMDIKPVKEAAETFKKEIGAIAKKNLDTNIKYMKAEKKRLFGDDGPPTMATREASLEQNARALKMIGVAEQLLRLRRKQKEMLTRTVGFKYVNNPVAPTQPVLFKPGNPPGTAWFSNETGPQYADLNDAWDAAALETGRQASKYPWLFGILKDPENAEARLQKLVDSKANPYAARVQVMGEMQTQIDQAQRVMDGYNSKEPDWYDLVPVRDQLFEKALDKNFDRLVARQVVGSREDAEWWKKVGFETLVFAALAVATLATAGMAPILAGVIAGAVAVGVPATQAYLAYQKAEELGQANRATVVPETDVVSQMEVDAAKAEAVAKTIEAVLNLAMLAGGAALEVRFELRLAKYAELGAAEQKAVLEKAILHPRHGAVGTSITTGLSLAELSARVGGDSPAGAAIRKELAELASKPVGELTTAQRNALRALQKTEAEGGVVGAERASLNDPRVAKLLGGQAQELIRNWTQMGTEAARLDWAKTTIRAHLKNAGIDVEIAVVAEGGMGPTSWGKFKPDKWTIVLNKEHLANNEATAATIAEMMKTIAHEGRHAEQFWLMARRLYGKEGWNHAKIAEALGLRQDLIASARAAGPIADKDAQAAMIDLWLKDFETKAARDFRAFYLTQKSEWKKKWVAADRAHLEAADAGKPAAELDALAKSRDAARAQYEAFYKMYRTSGVEADAYALEEGLKLDLAKEAEAKAIHDEMWKLRQQVMDNWNVKLANRESALELARKEGKAQAIIKMREADVAEAKNVLAKVRGGAPVGP